MTEPANPNALVQLATVGAPHGVRGEVRLKSFTGDPLALRSYGPLLARDGRSFTVLSLRPAKEVVVARLGGVDSREKAEALNGLPLFVPRDRLPPAEDGEFYHIDLIGLAVEDDTGADIGRIVAVHDFGAGEMLDIRLTAGGSALVPFTLAAVPVVDIAGGRAVLEPVAAGLIDEERDPAEPRDDDR